jgi:hypothetical protein
MTTSPPKRQIPKPEKSVIQWLLETSYPGEMPVEMDEGEGRPSRWITLRALRVLEWYSSGE